MIKITIPYNNIAERKYIIDILFDEFLGLPYKIVIGDLGLVDSEWVIELANGSRLIFEDHFFSKYPKDLEYLKLENIPAHIEFAQNEFALEMDIPLIYGNSKLNIQNSKLITCGIDIFASSFFMLTRWEEYVNKSRDSHNRFPATESLAFKYNFLDRPVVNEYVEMLKNMLLHLDSNLKFKIYNYQLMLTHDVDHIYKWDTLKKFVRHLAGDILQRKSLLELFKNIIYYVQVKTGIKNDPYDTFDYLMDISEKIGAKSYFFFMAEGITNHDNRYKTDGNEVTSLVEKIKKRNHFIGIHPTYNAYNDKEQFKKEKQELEKNLDTTMAFGRGHFLRFEVPTTWQIWEDNGMKWDSTCSYADKEGFRCGVCYEYSVFNVLTREKLNLKEKPLIVMEGSVFAQVNMNPKQMKNIIKNFISKVKKYNGDFVFLWHNSSFNIKEWREYQHIYEEVLK